MAVNKNTNTNKNDIRINIDLGDKKPKRRPRKKAPPPPPEPSIPFVQPAPQAFGINAYTPRPAIFAPSSTMIQPDNPVNPPAYFDKMFTNQQASLEEMRRAFQEELEDVRQQLMTGIGTPQEARQVERLTRDAQTEFEQELPAGVRAPDIDRYGLPPIRIGQRSPISPMDVPMREPSPDRMDAEEAGLNGLPRIRVRGGPASPVEAQAHPEPFDNPFLPFEAPPQGYQVPLDANIFVPPNLFNNPQFNQVPPVVEEPPPPPPLQNVIQQQQLPPLHQPLALPPQGPAPIIEEPPENELVVRRPQRRQRNDPIQIHMRQNRRQPPFPQLQQHQQYVLPALPAPEQLNQMLALPAPELEDDVLALPAPQQQLALPDPDVHRKRERDLNTALNTIALYRNGNESTRVKVQLADRIKHLARELGIDTRRKTREQIFALIEALQ